MQHGSDPARDDARETKETRLPPAVGIVLYALLYAGAIALLVIFAPSEPHVFIYQGF